MRDEVEKLIIDWLKSDNENTTYLAHEICDLFSVVGRSEQVCFCGTKKEPHIRYVCSNDKCGASWE